MPQHSPFPIVTVAIIALIVWRLYARVRRNIGPQHFVPARAWLTVTLFPLLIGLIALGLRFQPPLARLSLVGGLVGGVTLGVLGLRLTRFEAAAQGFYYVPSAHLGIALSTLLVARAVVSLHLRRRPGEPIRDAIVRNAPDSADACADRHDGRLLRDLCGRTSALVRPVMGRYREPAGMSTNERAVAQVCLWLPGRPKGSGLPGLPARSARSGYEVTPAGSSNRWTLRIAAARSGKRTRVFTASCGDVASGAVPRWSLLLRWPGVMGPLRRAEDQQCLVSLICPCRADHRSAMAAGDGHQPARALPPVQGTGRADA